MKNILRIFSFTLLYVSNHSNDIKHITNELLLLEFNEKMTQVLHSR